MERPQSIVWFERFYLGGVLLGLINSIISRSAIEAQVDATPGAALLPANFVIGIIVLGFIINLVLWFFVARRGAVLAKWIITIFFAVGAFSVIRALFNGAMPSVLIVIALVLQGVAVSMLFRAETKGWFARKQPNNPNTPLT